jgi:hypothetical protein
LPFKRNLQRYIEDTIRTVEGYSDIIGGAVQVDLNPKP